MRTRRAGVGIGALAALLTGVLACGDEPVGPKTSEFGEQREALVKRIGRRKQTEPAPAGATAKVAEAGPGLTPIDLRFTYDPEGKRDPFRPFEWDRLEVGSDSEMRGPLENFDLSQLDLVAVVWKTNNAKALVQDPAGQSYIIGQGTKIGKNEGRVLEIGDNSVLVKETYVDNLGQKTTKDIEMRIRGTEGG